jgi:hypothetical protein
MGPIHMVQGSDGNGIVVSDVDIKEVSRRWRPRIPRGLDFAIQGGFRVAAPIALT